MKFSALAILSCSLLLQSSAAHQPTLRKLSRSSKDEVEKCFEKCGSKNYKSDKLVECQNECVVTSESNGRTRSSMGPTGADDLLTCGSECADKAEKEYKDYEKDNKDKDCKKECLEGDEDCEKLCKEAEKQVKKDAEAAAETEYNKCSDKCFKESKHSFSFFEPFLRTTEDTMEKCMEKCGKFADKEGKIATCQTDCFASYPNNRSMVLKDCTAECANEAEETYEKETKDADDCKKSCDKEDDECKDACKEEEQEIEKEAQKKAEGDYGKCNDDCFEGSSFKLGYVA